MKITSGEKSKLVSEGVVVILCLCAIIGGILFLGHYLINKELENQQQILEANKNLLATNRRDARDIRFLRENQKSIEAMWSTLKNWGTGVSAYDLEVFDQVGIIDKSPIPATRIPSNPIEYGGMKVTGTKTEFQRVASAVADIENASGLLQIKSCVMQLPANQLPYSPRASYLETQMELLGPISQ
jgi:hypothetical protein